MKAKPRLSNRGLAADRNPVHTGQVAAWLLVNARRANFVSPVANFVSPTVGC
jgi:hypothetical protein